MLLPEAARYLGRLSLDVALIDVERSLMHRLFVPSWGPSDWRRLLASPGSQWVRGKSAFELAVSWEAARRTRRGIPEAVVEFLDRHELTRDSRLLLGLPELQVDLPGGGHASQTDLWALLGGGQHLISLAVEAKSGEPFDQPVDEWLKAASANSGKPARLAALREDLGLADCELAGIRYQLLHRGAAALRMAQEFGASTAVLLVQSFGGSRDRASLADFSRFADLMQCAASSHGPRAVGRRTCVPLLIGWVDCPAAQDAALADAM